MLRLADVAVLVADQDEAMRFYCGVLGFEVVEDAFVDGKRWVKVRGGGAGLVLRTAKTDEQRALIGKQAARGVFLFVETDDFDATYARLRGHGVVFVEEPRHEPYGTVVVFLDPYGNKIDLIQPAIP
jgi:catechol 2,3-dioxygenase-like lactoylglutathione lyase family enzyme